MRILEYAKKKMFRSADARTGSGRDERFLKSLTAKSLDEAWAILADGAENKWADYESPALMMEQARKIVERSSKGKNGKAIELIVLIAERKEYRTMSFLAESGFAFMRPEWVSNCMLAAILSGQTMVSDVIGRGIAEYADLLKGASLPGILPKIKREAQEIAAKNGRHGHQRADVFWQSTPLLAAISAGHINVATFLISKGLALEGSASALGERSALLGKKSPSGKFEISDAPSLVLGFAICEKKEKIQLALIDRIKSEGSQAVGWNAVGSCEMLRLAARHGQETAAIALLGGGGTSVRGRRRNAGEEEAAAKEMSQALLRYLNSEILGAMIASNMNRAAGKLVGIARASGDTRAIDILDAPNPLGMRSLSMAVSSGNEKLALQLIAAGVNLKSPVGARDSRSVAHLAAEKEMGEVLGAIIKALESSRDPGLGGSEGWEFMAFDACALLQGNVATRMIKAGAPLKSRVRDGFESGPLCWPGADDGVMLAVIDRVQAMPQDERSRVLEEGVWRDESADGFGPLALAVSTRGTHVVKALILAGASVENAKAQLAASRPRLVGHLDEILAKVSNSHKPEASCFDAAGMAERASKARLAIALADDMSGRAPMRSAGRRGC